MAGHPVGAGAAPGVIAAICLGLVGCGGEPVEPSSLAPELPAATSATSSTAKAYAAIPASVAREPGTKLDFSDDIADLRSRFLPSLEPRAAETLGRALDDLTTRGDDPAGAAAVLARASGALQQGDAAPADLDALRRTLEAMHASLTPSTPGSLTRSGGIDDSRAR